MATLSSMFVGNSLNSSTDAVYAFTASQMLNNNSNSNNDKNAKNNNDNANGVHVCPSVTQAVSRSTALNAQFHKPNDSANGAST